MSDATLILLAGVLLALGIGATLVASRLRVPGLVLFLVLGMIVGPDGLHVLELEDVELARTIGVIALALILFEGGLAAGWQEIRPALWPSVSLALIGTVATAAIVGLAANQLLGLGMTEALLLGAIVAPTDGAAVFSVLRGSSLERRLARVLEAESGLNDPVAIVLVLGLIDVIQKPDFGAADVVLLAVEQLAVGAVVGVAAGWLGAQASTRIRFSSTGLYPVASIATAALSFGVAAELGGSGFLSVYLTGLALGGAPIPRRTVADFHDGLAWVSQIAVFFTLGLLVVPSGFGAIAGDALLVAAVLMLLARPLAVPLATIGAGISLREQALLGWAGLRGAVPIVLATFAVIEGVPEAGRFFDIVFFVVLASTIVQGVTLEPLARRLRVTGPRPALSRPLLEVGTIRRLGAEVVEFPVRAGDAVVGRLVNELGLPREALVSVIVRGEEALLPRGSTEIAAGDRLHILVRQRLRAAVEELFERWRQGPLGEPEAEAVPLFGRAAIFSVRPLDATLGEGGVPDAVDGVPVRRVLRLRRGEPGALVQLDDGRYAVTGEGRVAVGAPRRLFRYCRDRIGRARDEQARAWWQEVAGVLAARVVR